MAKNVQSILMKKESGQKLVLATAYDYHQARLADQAGVDMLLVGDSLGRYIQGGDSYLQVTVEEIIYHCRAVARGCKQALIVAGMPFGSYHVSTEQAVANALRIIKEGGADGVKLEGDQVLVPRVKALTNAGIPVMAHIGRMAQRTFLWEDQPVYGMDEESAWELAETAQALEDAGAFAIFMERVAKEAATLITGKVDVPTIGMGCGPGCDGQALVFHQLLGLDGAEQPPQYARRFAEGDRALSQGLQAYCQAVRSGQFPEEQHAFPMEEGEAKRLY